MILVLLLLLLLLFGIDFRSVAMLICDYNMSEVGEQRMTKQKREKVIFLMHGYFAGRAAQLEYIYQSSANSILPKVRSDTHPLMSLHSSTPHTQTKTPTYLLICHCWTIFRHLLHDTATSLTFRITIIHSSSSIIILRQRCQS